MKLEELSDKYRLKLTNHIKKYYYSKIPMVDKEEIDYYEIKTENSISSKGIAITQILQNESEFRGIRLGYRNDDDEFNEKEVTFNEPAKIKKITGNPEKYFVEDMTFEIVEKEPTTSFTTCKTFETL